MHYCPEPWWWEALCLNICGSSSQILNHSYIFSLAQANCWYPRFLREGPPKGRQEYLHFLQFLLILLLDIKIKKTAQGVTKFKIRTSKVCLRCLVPFGGWSTLYSTFTLLFLLIRKRLSRFWRLFLPVCVVFHKGLFRCSFEHRVGPWSYSWMWAFVNFFFL